MALKIEDWGKILLEHYEKNPDSFYISLEDILSGAKLYDPAFVSRLTDSIKERGSGYTVDEHLTRTFARALCPMRQQMDTHDIAESLRNAWFNGPEGADLCVLALLICACEAHTEGIRTNNYYERLKVFLSSKEIGYWLRDDVTFSTPFFNVNNGIDLIGLFDKVNNTCKTHDIPLELTITRGNRGRTRYTNTIMSLCLINGTIIDRFKYICGQSGFNITDAPANDELLSAFKNHYPDIHISEENARIMLDEREQLLRAMRRAYDSWDGATTYTFKSSQNGKTVTSTEIGSTAESILLALVPSRSRGETKVELQAIVYSEANLESSLRFYTSVDGIELKTRIRNRKSEFLKNDNTTVGALVLQSLNDWSKFELTDSEHDCKAIFKPKYYYLFRSCYGVWEEVVQPGIGQSYLLLVCEENKDEVLQSLGGSNAVPYDKISSPIDGFGVYMLENLKALPANNRRKSRNDQPIVTIDNFIFGDDVKTVVLSDKRLIVSADGLNDEDAANIRIVSTDSKKSHQLTYSDNLWILDFSSIRFDCFDYSRLWKLYAGTKEVLPYEFKFGDFHIPTEFRGMSLTIDGEIAPKGALCGLELDNNKLRHGAIVDATRIGIEANNESLPQNGYEECNTSADKLLYALTSISYDFFNLIDIESAVAVLAPSTIDGLENMLSNWFVLGYLNIGNEGSVRKFVVNRPTLVLMTPYYAPADVEGVRAAAVSHFTCLLTGGRDKALIDGLLKMQFQNPYDFTIEFVKVSDNLPHSIFVHSKKIDMFSKIAAKFNLLFYPKIFAPAMFASLPSVSQYDQEARKRSVAYSGRALTYDIAAISTDLLNEKMQKAASYKRETRGRCGLNIYSQYGRKIGVMTNVNGESYHVGRNWGLWIQASNENQQLAIAKGNELIVPGVTPLPRIYQRAVSLITGQLPTYDPNIRTNHYHLAYNPTAPGQNITGEGIINKLS